MEIAFLWRIDVAIPLSFGMTVLSTTQGVLAIVASCVKRNRALVTAHNVFCVLSIVVHSIMVIASVLTPK